MTTITDQQLAEAVNSYVKANPSATRKQIANSCGASRERITRLHKEGMVHKWPNPLPRRAAAVLNAHKSCWHQFRSLKK